MPTFKNKVTPVNQIAGGKLNGVKQIIPPKKKNALPLPGEGLPRYAHFNADQSGCGFWRMIWPSEQLLIYNKAVVSTMYQMVLDPVFYRGISAVRLQRQCTENQYEFVKHLKKVSRQLKDKNGEGFKIIWEVDDVVCPVNEIPSYNRCKEAFTNPQLQDTVKRIVHLCDEVTVVSNRMREHYKEHLSYDKISIIPNYFPRNWAEGHYDPEAKLASFSKNKQEGKIRIGYAGSATHFDVAHRNGYVDDFTHVVKHVADRVDDYQFVFFGGYPAQLAHLVKQGKIEYHPWGNLDKYPAILAGLNLDVMIAPLQANAFSESKSSIKYLEGAALGVPCVSQDLPPYENCPWRFTTGEEMFDHIEKITFDENTYEFASELARSEIEKYWLDDHLDELKLVYDTPYADKKRLENASFLNNNKFQFDNSEIPVYNLSNV